MAQLTINTDDMQDVGFDTNILAATQDKYLIFVIDTSVNLGISQSGKMTSVANSGGFQPMPGGLKGNVYVGKKNT